MRDTDLTKFIRINLLVVKRDHWRKPLTARAQDRMKDADDYLLTSAPRRAA